MQAVGKELSVRGAEAFGKDGTFVVTGTIFCYFIGMITIFQTLKFVNNGSLQGVGMMKEIMFCGGKKMNILYVNACARKDSRTNRIAQKILEKLGGDVQEVKLVEIQFPKTSEDFLKKRDASIAARDYADSYFDLAKQFAKADVIVITAPYWDLSFPAALKQYIEHINVLGITFEYSPQGTPVGLCKASKLYYAMTAGGSYVPEEFGFGYIKALAQNFYGIKEVELIKATGLDIQGNDAEAILRERLAGL